MAKQLGTITKLPSGSYRLRYNKDKQTFSKTIKAKNETEARKILNKMITEIESNTFQKDDRITFLEFSQYWLDNYARPNLSPTTVANNINALNKNILKHFGHLKLISISKMHINNFIQTLKEQGLSYSTQKNYLTITSSILRYAVELELLQVNVAHNIKIRKDSTKEAKEMQIYNHEDLQMFFKALDEDENKLLTNMLYLALYTGLRRGELMGLMPQDINFKDGTVTISRTKVKVNSKNIIKDTKTHKSRTFLLPQKVLDILKEFCKNKKNDELLFDVDAEYLTKAFPKFIAKHNLKKIRLYDLRHTNASMLHSEGVDYATIAARLGNLPSTTANFYIHKVTEKDKQARDILNNIFK